MRGILGLIFLAGGIWAAWWAFSKTETGGDFYDLVGLGAIIVSVIGILLIILRIKQWWMSEE